MKIMKKITILILIVSTAFVANAQQLPQFTQYMINDYVFNPAIAGTESSYQMKTNIRNQWVGVTDAPRTTVLSIYGKYRESNVGLGGVVFNDQVGPTSRTGLSLSYAYHFSLTDNMKMSLAVSGGFTQMKIDPSLLNVFDLDDPIMNGGVLESSVPDATFAFYLYSNDWYVGASIPQLLNSNLGFFDDKYIDAYNIDPDGSLERHYFAMAGYKWKVNYDYVVEPSVLLKSVTPAPIVVDIGLKVTYQNKLWMGTNYRTNGDIGLLLGYSIGDRYLIGYSYDMITSGLGDYTSGSHEFMLGIRFAPATEKEIMK
jgi:type IX secretion system PorP/SprF family membrane protein|tara:strand:- start:4930 stop:5868 length:939 start_codon:yes stop_codon:yes gene_type:complete